MKSFLRPAAVLIGWLVLPAALHAWSNKEHIQLTRIAARLLIEDAGTPAAMKRWLRDAEPALLDARQEQEYFMQQRIGIIPRQPDGLAFWAVVPDMKALIDDETREVAPFGVPERVLHYLDVEVFNPDESKRAYADDLSHKPSLDDFPRDLADPRYRQAGMLPFRVEQCYRALVEQIARGRLVDRPGQFPRDEHAARWAGYLAHYAQDNTQPQHATVDYKSASYFGERGATTAAPNVHAEMEYRMCDDEFADFPGLRAEYWPLLVEAISQFRDPIQTDDPWRATIEITLVSYDALPLIGHAARSAVRDNGKLDTEKFFRYRGPCFGQREMSVLQLKARQQAWAIKRTMRLWRQAWNAAHAPPACGAPASAPSDSP